MDVPHGFLLRRKKMKNKVQKDQNKYIRFCLSLPPRCRIDPLHSKKIKRFLARDRVQRCIANTVFKY